MPYVPILYYLKTPKKPKVFWCFQGVKNREIGQKWVKRKMNQVGKKIQNMLPAIESDIRESWIVS